MTYIMHALTDTTDCETSHFELLEKNRFTIPAKVHKSNKKSTIIGKKIDKSNKVPTAIRKVTKNYLAVPGGM